MGGSSAGGGSEARSAAAELIDFAIERERHVRFVGREDVLARLDHWLLGPDDTRWVVVTGGPGMGKSAVLSKWLARREAAGAQVPQHFVRRQVIDWDQPERIEISLAAQIEAMFPELRDDSAATARRASPLTRRHRERIAISSTSRQATILNPGCTSRALMASRSSCPSTHSSKGCAAISLQGLPDCHPPKLDVRTGIDADKLIVAADSSSTGASAFPR